MRLPICALAVCIVYGRFQDPNRNSGRVHLHLKRTRTLLSATTPYLQRTNDPFEYPHLTDAQESGPSQSRNSKLINIDHDRFSNWIRARLQGAEGAIQQTHDPVHLGSLPWRQRLIPD